MNNTSTNTNTNTNTTLIVFKREACIEFLGCGPDHGYLRVYEAGTEDPRAFFDGDKTTLADPESAARWAFLSDPMDTAAIDTEVAIKMGWVSREAVERSVEEWGLS